MLVLAPVLLLALFGAVQVGLWYHAKNSLLAAAQSGATEARIVGGGDPTATAQQVASQAGVQDIAVHSSKSGGMVTVTVTGRATLAIDLGFGTISQSASAPVERVTHP